MAISPRDGEGSQIAPESAVNYPPSAKENLGRM
jgi:hypothetical protein